MLSKLLHADLVSIVLSKLVASFGRGLVGVFIPLLLLGKGLELWHVCAFYAAYALCKLAVNYPSTRLINTHGARLGLVVGYISTAVTMVLLTAYIATGEVWILAIMALATAIQNSFLWNSEHLHVSRVLDAARRSRDLAMMANLDRILSIFTPLIGGFIAFTFGELWLVTIASIILILAIIPIWKMDKLAGGHHRVDNLRYNLKQAPMRDIVANFAFNAHVMVGIMVWPIYLAVFVPSFRDIGIITTVASAAAIVILHFVAKRADSGKTYRVLVEGTAASSLVHIGRVMATSNPLTITLISALYDIALSYQQNPWASLYYAHTKKGGINYVMSMEIAGDLAYVIMWGILGIVAYFTGDNLFFTVAFGLAAAVAWLCLLMRRDTTVAATA